MASDTLIRRLAMICGTILLLLLVGTLPGMVPAIARNIPSYNSNIAEIVNSGSTNTCGYKIYVAPDGRELYHMCYDHGYGRLSVALAQKFLHDIKMAEPLNRLPHKTCVKSVSFGTATSIKYYGQQSPDISCPANHLEELLYADAVEIAQALQVSNQPSHQKNLKNT